MIRRLGRNRALDQFPDRYQARSQRCRQGRRASALTVTLDVANTGSRDGDDVVQLYATPPASSQPQEIRALCGFTRVSLKAGEKRTVEITVPAVALRRWNITAKDYSIPAGEWTLGAGASSADIRQKITVGL